MDMCTWAFCGSWSLQITLPFTYLCPIPSIPVQVYLSTSHLTTLGIPVQTHPHSSMHIWAGIAHKALVRRKSVICYRVASCQPTLHAEYQKRRNNVVIRKVKPQKLFLAMTSSTEVQTGKARLEFEPPFPVWKPPPVSYRNPHAPNCVSGCLSGPS